MTGRKGKEVERGTCASTAFAAEENTCIGFPFPGAAT
jgi:hypothetical protein